jgi:hypothetical protein
MSCEKYTGWMTDAPLGELRAEREPELLAHAMNCDACREALHHATKVRELVERGVESLVEGEPSPQFVMRLRRRIAEEPRPVQSYWTAWAPIAAGALVLAMFLAIVVARIPLRHGPEPSVASSLKPIPSSPDTAAPSAASPLKARKAADKRAPERVLSASTPNAGLPKIIVPKAQLSAAAQLSEAINSGRVDGDQLLAAQREYEKPLDVKPIEIAPLESPSLPEDIERPAVAPTILN